MTTIPAANKANPASVAGQSGSVPGSNTGPASTTVVGVVGSSHVLLTVSVELLAVGLFTLLAGTSPDVGNIVVLFMVGLWVIYLISDASTVSGIGNALSSIASGA